MYHLWRRPFESFLALLVGVVGFSQAFLDVGYPPEMAEVIPCLGLKIYGLYILLATLAWLVSLWREHALLERAALTALAGAFFLVVGAELYYSALLDIPGIALDLTVDVGWQMGLGISAVARATYISSVLRKAAPREH